jgi:hypothetical protein
MTASLSLLRTPVSSRSPGRRLWLIDVALGLYLLGQLGLLLHHWDLEGHPGGESCEVCLVGQAADPGGTSQAGSLASQSLFQEPHAALPVRLDWSQLRLFLARAPPQRLS